MAIGWVRENCIEIKNVIKYNLFFFLSDYLLNEGINE